MNNRAGTPGRAAYEMDRRRTPEPWWTRRRIAYAICGTAALTALAAADRYLLRQRVNVVANEDTVAAVERGPLRVAVQGAGTLEPLDARLVSADASGAVGEILARPGTEVRPGDPLLRLRNPSLRQQVRQAEIALTEASASHRVLLARFEERKLAAEAALAQATASASEAALRLAAEERLIDQRAISGVDYERTRIRAEQAQDVLEIERRRREQLTATIEAERAESKARVENRALAFDLAQAGADALLVRSGSAGTVQEVLVVAGEPVVQGTVVARVADDGELRAAVRVPETYASKLAVGQAATVVALNTDVPAHVVRVDPGVIDGTVGVSLEFETTLPAGVRPDLSVRATILVAEIEDALFVRRPAGVFDNHAASVFVLDERTGVATRRRAQFGIGSLREVQVLDGLRQGDRILIGQHNTLS